MIVYDQVELYGYQLGTGRGSRSLFRRLKSLLGGGEGKRGSPARYTLLGWLVLGAGQAGDSVASHQLELESGAGAGPGLFGALCCRLAVLPHCRSLPGRAGRLTAAWPDSQLTVPACFARILDWRLQVWTSRAQYRRGETPWQEVMLDSHTTVRDLGNSFTLENPGQETVQFLCETDEEVLE